MAQPQGGQTFTLPSASELTMSIMICALVIVILLPMPVWLLDVILTMNISLGVILLMMSLYVQKPLDMAAFPSIILVGTMFRLALSIAATRSILSKGEAGGIIHAFGELVTGGNLIVGAVIFIIITLVQFMVITKGAERIAEVGARFALDAMPGKQMTIDADFNAGLISPEEAIKKREDLQRESALFGSMDGAMKFVKGDAIAGIIITVINAIGGLAIGMLMNGMAIDEALQHYTILTVGDGLAAQVPALLMSVASGLMMSRSTANEGSLAKDLFAQVQGKPYGLIFSAVFLGLIGISGLFGTGMPIWAFLPIALGLGAIAFSVFLTTDVQQQLGQLDQVKENMSELINPNRMYEKLGVDPLSLQVGNDLLVIADPDQDGQLLGKIAGLRSRMTDELGFILPNIRIMDSVSIGPNEYLISIRNNPVASANVYPGRYMIPASQFQMYNLTPPKNAIMDMEPTFGIEEAYWLLPQEIPEQLQKNAIDATDALIEHLKEVVIKHVDEVMAKMDVLKLMELVRQQDQSIIQELVPNILTPNDLRKIFVNLVREKVSIKDIMFVFERLSDYARFSKEPDILSERLRAALGRQICLLHADKNKNLYAVTLSNEWEKILDDSCQRTELGTMFLLNPLQVQELIEITGETLRRVQQTYDRVPVILCSPRIRLPLFQLLDRHIPIITVMSYSELIPDIQVQAVGTIGTSDFADNYGYSA
ncbi:flagellar biosynthesis protein FlhA [Vampirovibrio chlorellavorus]|uniref:flagellar biosynthesis protein FlhA n=1 Tax=Vampirovibrio chlorellavorus TaxID=758823 RepID=UPI0026F23BDE|nr:flagellar biosynthesis protein FlhA [Vampirovibrio chlorellavorus]